MTTAATRTVFCSPLMMMKTRQFNKSRGKITLAVVVYVKEETKKKKKRKVGVKSSFASSSREVDKSDDCFVVRHSVSSSAKKETLSSSESSKLLLLENVPIAIKDNIDVKGLKTGCGNPDFLSEFSPKAKTENAP